MEPFPTSVFKVCVWIFATTTKICTKGCFTQAYVWAALQPSRPPTHKHNKFDLWLSISSLLQRHPFSGLVHSAGVSCYTLLSGFQLPWSPYCCLNEPTLLWDPGEQTIWHFNQRLDDPASPNQLTQCGPLEINIPQQDSIKQLCVLTHLKLENRSRANHSRNL